MGAGRENEGGREGISCFDEKNPREGELGGFSLARDWVEGDGE